MPAEAPRPERDEAGVILHPSTVLALCEAESAKWWGECDVRAFVEAVRRDPTPGRMEAFARQCFEEGAYRGAVNAAEGGRARLTQAERALATERTAREEAERERDILRGHYEELQSLYVQSQRRAEEAERLAGERLEALRKVRSHANLIRLAPERRYAVAVLDTALAAADAQGGRGAH